MFDTSLCGSVRLTVVIIFGVGAPLLPVSSEGGVNVPIFIDCLLGRPRFSNKRAALPVGISSGFVNRGDGATNNACGEESDAIVSSKSSI